jgi:oligoribonuclease (3'-5' exoribonuclease)
MKATIEYDLNDSDDTMAHMRAVKSLSMACALNDIRESLRNKDKYGDYSEEVHKAISDIRQEVNELIHTYGIIMDELL